MEQKKRIKIFLFQPKTCFLLPKKGFSLVEVLVTMMVLSIGITTVAALMTSNLKSLNNSRDQVVASMLAQEGIELVRNLKDSGKLDVDKDGVCNFAQDGPCNDHRLIVDATTTSDIEKASNDQKVRLYLADDYFTHDTEGEDTKFFRALDIEVSGVASSQRILTVTSHVTWNDEGFSAISGFPGTCNIANKCVSTVSIMPDI